MTVSRLFAPLRLPLSADIVLLLMRLAVGYAFTLIGTGKIQNPFHWMGPESSVPSFLQALAALSEFGGGIALILGLLTRLASLGIACTMVGAVIMHRFVMGDPFVNLTAGGGSYQLPVMYLLIALMLVVTGPGRISLDRRLFGTRSA